MRKLYCISGLGADERIFTNISVKDTELVHLPWIKPEKSDTVTSYAQHMADLIPDPEPLILGLSFGGMVGVEIAKIRAVKKLFLISSAKTKHELPSVNTGLRFLLLNRLIPQFAFKIPNKIVFREFGAYTNEEQTLLRSILKSTDGYFMQWALKALMYWDNTTIPDNIIHIHGTADKVIPLHKIEANYRIEQGTHMMVYNRTREINAIIEKEMPRI